MARVLEGNQLVRSKNKAKKRFEPRIRLGTKVQSNSRIQLASNQFKSVPRKLDPGPSSKWALFSNLQIWNLVLGKAPGHWGHFRKNKWPRTRISSLI
jgi:hypothetical protein